MARPSRIVRVVLRLFRPRAHKGPGPAPPVAPRTRGFRSVDLIPRPEGSRESGASDPADVGDQAIVGWETLCAPIPEGLRQLQPQGNAHRGEMVRHEPASSPPAARRGSP